MSITRFPNGIESFTIPRDYTEVSAAATLNATTDVGGTFYVTTANLEITLPALLAGAQYVYTIVNGCPDGTSLLSVKPGSGDGISFITQVDDEKIKNTAVTSKRGDYVTVTSNSLGVFWVVNDAHGIWAKVA